MRLKPSEKEAFEAVLSTVMTPGDGALYLYGSRADDALKGGDIDLALVLTGEEPLARINPLRHSLVFEFKKRVGEQRIDFSILTRQQAAQDAFYSSALKKSVLLREW